VGRTNLNLIQVRWYATREHAANIELRAISLLKPEFNKAGAEGFKPGRAKWSLRRARRAASRTEMRRTSVRAFSRRSPSGVRFFDIRAVYGRTSQIFAGET
jgi:hypothetical protein